MEIFNIIVGLTSIGSFIVSLISLNKVEEIRKIAVPKLQ